MVTLGQRILGYTLQEVIGEGGMATIYRASNPLGKQKAIKILKPEFTSDPHVRQRFEQEAQIMVRLGEHTVHICQVDDLEVTPHYVALVMEYLQGENLATYLRLNGPVSPHQLAAWMEPVLLAVGYAHKQDVVHRDIKPANLYLTTQGQIKVLDFGIAKVLSSGDDLTFTQQMIGSPRYMSPEQILTPKQVDHRSDIYSLGVTMWALLTGHRPFAGEINNESDFMIQTRIVNQLLPPLDGKAALLNPVIQQATAKAIENRYQNCQLLSEALANALKTPSQPAIRKPHSEEDKTQVLKRPSAESVSLPVVQLVEEPLKTPNLPKQSPPPTVEIPLEPALSSPPPTVEFSLEPVVGATLPKNKKPVKTLILYGLIPLVVVLFGIYLFQILGEQKNKPSDQSLWQGQRQIIPFIENDRYGIKDKTSGQILVQPQFSWADAPATNAMLVKLQSGNYRIIGTDGMWRSDTINGHVEPFSQGIALIKSGEKFGYINTNGMVIIKLQFDGATSFNGGLAAVRKNGKWGYIDVKGKTTIDFQFDEAAPFNDDLAKVKKNDNWGYINKTGKTVIDFQFGFSDPFNNDFSLASSNGKWGYINTKGKPLINFQFDKATPFKEGLAAVRKNGKWGYIDMKGKPLINFQFDEAAPFNNGEASVKKNGEWGHIDKTGQYSLMRNSIRFYSR